MYVVYVVCIVLFVCVCVGMMSVLFLYVNRESRAYVLMFCVNVLSFVIVFCVLYVFLCVYVCVSVL